MELYNCKGVAGKQRAGVMHMETVLKDYINPVLIIAEEVLVCVLAKALLGQPLAVIAQDVVGVAAVGAAEPLAPDGHCKLRLLPAVAHE